MAANYRIRPGTFVVWGTTGPQLGHSDNPFDHHEPTPDVIAALSGFARSATVDDVVARLGVSGETRAETRAALIRLASAGLLQECDPEPSEPVAPLRTPGMEAARAAGTYSDIRVLDPDFVDLYERLQNATQTSIPMSFALRIAVRYVIRSGIPGDIVECGVWRGGSAAIAAATLGGRWDRDIWLYDTFSFTWDPPTAADGVLLPSGEVKLADLESDASDAAKAQGSDQAAVRATVCQTGFPAARVHCVEGLVQDTLPDRAPDRIAILRLDTDLYDSTRHELEHLYPRSPGGVLIVDDYGKFSGATRAVDEYFERVDEPILLNRIDTQGRIGVKTS